jgi:hypothetical protein
MRFSKLLLILVCGFCFADDKCITIPTAKFTPDQIARARPLAYGIALDAGHNIVPVVSLSKYELDLCFADSTFDPSAISTTTLVNYYVNNPGSLATLTATIDGYETELSTTTQAIILGYNNFYSLTQTQINTGLKNVVRVLWLRNILGFR